MMCKNCNKGEHENCETFERERSYSDWIKGYQPTEDEKKAAAPRPSCFCLHRGTKVARP
jgi:hypothetical protein